MTEKFKKGAVVTIMSDYKRQTLYIVVKFVKKGKVVVLRNIKNEEKEILVSIQVLRKPINIGATLFGRSHYIEKR